MEIDKSRIVRLLNLSGEEDKAVALDDALPERIDIDSDEHLSEMSKLGVDPSILTKLDGFGASNEGI